MSLLSQSGLIFVAYLAAGRVGAIATCLILGISPWETLFIALLIDGCQIPVYGLMLFNRHRKPLTEPLIVTYIRIHSAALPKHFL